MPNTVSDFKLDLKKFADTVDLKLETVLKKVAMDAFNGVVKKTPVQTGSARSSWMITVDAPPSTEVKEKTGNGSKAGATSEAKQQLTNLGKVTSKSYINISNNLPYIAKLEYGGYPAGPKITGGFSKQAPQGMVGVTMQEISQSLLGQIS